jgi:MYXO-CTERM domain-containing protein
VILYQTSMRNTWAPSGTLLNSGWQYEGRWGQFLGTAISPRHFITAEHVGGAVGQTFSYHGKTYTTKAVYDDPKTDLRIWLVDRPFTDAYAQLYRGTSEVGKQAIFYGRGTQRGANVVVNNQLKGWQWGAYDGQQSWGTNNIMGLVNGGTGIGTVLRYTFDAGGGRNEGTVSGYDSGGGGFVNDNGVWKLAGVNFSAKGPYSLKGANGSAFNASLFDEGGLYVGNDGYRWYQADTAANVAGGGYLSRVSAEAAWIDSIIKPSITAKALTVSGSVAPTGSAVPEPSIVGAGVLLGVGALARRRRR